MGSLRKFSLTMVTGFGVGDNSRRRDYLQWVGELSFKNLRYKVFEVFLMRYRETINFEIKGQERRVGEISGTGISAGAIRSKESRWIPEMRKVKYWGCVDVG